MYYVYLLASHKHGTLYVGVTSNLLGRVYQHKTGVVRGFTRRYHVHLLVWFECYDDPLTAIARERQVSVAAVMRDAIREFLTRRSDEQLLVAPEVVAA